MRLDPIVLVPSDDDWPVSFERERGRLIDVFGDRLTAPIEHIGSTAIPGLAAKPIIDMVAVVDNVDRVAPSMAALAEIGWLPAPEPWDAVERSLSFCTPSVEHRTHHLHVVESTSLRWPGWLAFRDHLRHHPELVAEYATLKAGLAARYGADPNRRHDYRSGKADWVERVTAEALAGPGPTGPPAPPPHGRSPHS
jgi:GrpB-like predicted nucleotidyltransferase (UPF0157 family)